MRRADFHVHTTFCDGANTPEEMVLAALAAGMDCIGFSGHSHTAFDESWCMSVEGTGQYQREIARLKTAYAGQIQILCGVEQDFFSDAPTDGYDYVIGSVHYLNVGNTYVPVDESAALLLQAADDYFGGDLYALTEAYYRTVSEVCERTRCDLIGHFDLIAKFNEDGSLFDEAHPRYTAAWQAAADRLLAYRKPFEINTGAIARGYRTTPYPSRSIAAYLAAHGAEFVLSGDSHSAGALCCEFDKWEAAAQQMGLRLIRPQWKRR